MIHGNEVSLRLITSNCDISIPFANKTLRDKYDVLTHEAAIEGSGLRRCLTERVGATGGFTTPLTLDTAPAILGVMFGDSSESSFVSETRNLYVTHSDLCAADAAKRFTLVEQIGNTKKEYSGCVCSGFELRIHRGEAVKAHLDVDSCTPAVEDGSGDEGEGRREKVEKALRIGSGGIANERFKEDGVSYFADGKFWRNIYAALLSVNKVGGCKTVLTLSRVLQSDDLPEHISFLHIPLVLFREKYEERTFGRFMIILSDLHLISDGTEVNAADAVIGALRYAVAGFVSVETYRSGK